MLTEINAKNAPAPIGPYSQAILANGMLYLSGQIALDPITNELVTESLKAQTIRVMENIKAVLEQAGSNLRNVIKCSIFLSDMNSFQEVNDTYASYFESPYPARETVEVSKLPKGVDIEISVIALAQ